MINSLCNIHRIITLMINPRQLYHVHQNLCNFLFSKFERLVVEHKPRWSRFVCKPKDKKIIWIGSSSPQTSKSLPKIMFHTLFSKNLHISQYSCMHIYHEIESCYSTYCYWRHLVIKLMFWYCNRIHIIPLILKRIYPQICSILLVFISSLKAID